MTVGLLASKESVHIRLGENREIVSADDVVFEAQHQEESRTMIHEFEYLSDYLDDFSVSLLMGNPQFVTVTELGRQTTFRYETDGGKAIVLTRAHRGVEQALKEIKTNPVTQETGLDRRTMGPQSPTNETLGRLLTDLYSQPGVCGACLQVRDTVLIHDLPYSDDRIAGLAKRIDRLIAGYENVGRSIWQICAGFEKYRLLILCRSNTRLSILLKPEIDPALIAGRATRLLMEVEIPEAAATEAPLPEQPVEPAPVVVKAAVPEGMPREDLEKLVVGLLGRVTGSVTASKLIQRELSGKNGSVAFPKEEARKLGLAVLENIPNRGKREALVSEFLNALNT